MTQRIRVEILEGEVQMGAQKGTVELIARNFHNDGMWTTIGPRYTVQSANQNGITRMLEIEPQDFQKCYARAFAALEDIRQGLPADTQLNIVRGRVGESHIVSVGPRQTPYLVRRPDSRDFDAIQTAYRTQTREREE